MSLVDFVYAHAERGSCTCGKCIDAPATPFQPSGHTADLVFFKVSMKEGTSKEEFERLARDEFPQWFDGQEHSYLEVGGHIGDQGLALTAMGLGKLLGVWDLLTPNSILPDLDETIRMNMAGQGYITIKVKQ
jgi:hypothetical protein